MDTGLCGNCLLDDHPADPCIMLGTGLPGDPPVVDKRTEQAAYLDRLALRRDMGKHHRKQAQIRKLLGALYPLVSKTDADSIKKYPHRAFVLTTPETREMLAKKLGISMDKLYDLMVEVQRMRLENKQDHYRMVRDAQDRPVVITVMRQERSYIGPAEGGQYADVEVPVKTVIIHDRDFLLEEMGALNALYSNKNRPPLYSVNSNGVYKLYVGYLPEPAHPGPPFGYYE